VVPAAIASSRPQAGASRRESRRLQRSGSRAQRWFRVDLWPRACDRGRFVLRDRWRRNQLCRYSRDQPPL